MHRLDEENLAVAVADATGHGIPAALLTVFIKRALRGKEIEDGRYRIMRPNEVLIRLNEELLDAQLSDCSFVAATYAVLNTRTLTVALARAGSPYPIVRRNSGLLELLRPAGGVVGVTPDARFAVETLQLDPGDALLITSDGLDSVAIPHAAASGVAGVLRELPKRQLRTTTRRRVQTVVSSPLWLGRRSHWLMAMTSANRRPRDLDQCLVRRCSLRPGAERCNELAWKRPSINWPSATMLFAGWGSHSMI